MLKYVSCNSPHRVGCGRVQEVENGKNVRGVVVSIRQCYLHIMTWATVSNMSMVVTICIAEIWDILWPWKVIQSFEDLKQYFRFWLCARRSPSLDTEDLHCTDAVVRKAAVSYLRINVVDLF